MRCFFFFLPNRVSPELNFYIVYLFRIVIINPCLNNTQTFLSVLCWFLYFLSWQEASLRAFYIPDEPQVYELQSYSQQGLFTDDIINRNGTPDNKPIFKETVSESWVLRSKPKETEVVKIYSSSRKWALLLLFCFVLSSCLKYIDSYGILLVKYIESFIQTIRSNVWLIHCLYEWVVESLTHLIYSKTLLQLFSLGK